MYVIDGVEKGARYFTASTLEDAAKLARLTANSIQRKNPLAQINFFLEEEAWRSIDIPEWMQTYLLEDLK